MAMTSSRSIPSRFSAGDRLRSCIARWVSAKPRIQRFSNYRWLAGQSKWAWQRRLRRLFLSRVGQPFLVEWVEGLRLWLHPADDMTDLLVRTGVFEPNEMTWYAGAVQQGMTIIDAGANAGLYTMLASRRVGTDGRVIAIEASPREQGRLREHVLLNGLENVTIVPRAVGDQEGAGQLRIAQWPHAGQNTLGDFVYRGVETQMYAPVDITTVDRIVAELELDRVDLIKIDTEGADAKVLRGAMMTLKRYRPGVLIEVNDPTLAHQGCHSRDIWRVLTELDYDIYEFSAEAGVPVAAAQQPHYPDTVNLLALPRPAAQEVAA